MTVAHIPFLGTAYLRSVWFDAYQAFCDSSEEASLLERLRHWSDRKDLKETSAEIAFVTQFFQETWGYHGSGQTPPGSGYTMHPKYPIVGAGAGGGTGAADLALGWFDHPAVAGTPQVVCEFKDIRSKLDAPQQRKGSKRTPVKQACDYLAGARRGLFGNESVRPTWAVATDMNEFRLYWYDRMPHQFLRFVIRPEELFQGRGLLADTDEARFERFMFYQAFQRDMLLTTGGRCALEELIAAQRFREREIENEFYKEYSAFRERLYNALLTHNASFAGTRGQLVRLAQSILDRCIFILYCEDMGQALRFPPQLLRDYLMERSRDTYYDSEGGEIWEGLRRLFEVLDGGGLFAARRLNAFNGGLFQQNEELHSLRVPNYVFCERSQGDTEANLRSAPNNLLYLSAVYNFAAKSDGSKSLGLYTLGRIFEQSITELEIREAEVDGRPSIGKVTKRKRDGVYYTPEWVVDTIVDETLGRRLEELKIESGWLAAMGQRAEVDAIGRYLERVKQLTVLDPACGSGAFLITALGRLVDEIQAAHAHLSELGRPVKIAEQELVRDVLSQNLYGVDINGASVEIAQLALWLHTACPDAPLSMLDNTIRSGNSLVDDTFYLKQDLLEYTDEERERINTFNWKETFPDVIADGGFDVIIGNPPYVKLQNFRRVHPDVASYLREGRHGRSYYGSTQSGNFDIYLPFIERAISLLNENGRMGFIAPSLWTKNEYGAGLRELVHTGRHLERWIDFKAFQVFDEAITYTALQFYTARPNESVRIFQAPAGDADIAKRTWDDPKAVVPYSALDSKEPWLLLPLEERELIERVSGACLRLDDPLITKAIFQGLITSADYIYHLERLGRDRYLCRPKDDRGRRQTEYEVVIEDAVMRPLISGPQAKRYEEPATRIHILFPYEAVGGRAQLVPPQRMQREYPNAWRHLGSYEQELRARENGAFDDERWYRFGRHQNIDKQDLPKLIVAQTVPNLRVCADDDGAFCLDNVRVNGILTAADVDMWFLLAVVNSAFADFAFRRLSVPKSGGYFEANKQFIAPLPVPAANERSCATVARLARDQQANITQRRRIIEQISSRREASGTRSRPETWLWPEIGTLDHWEARAPAHLDSRERADWAKRQRSKELSVRLEAIQARLQPRALLEAERRGTELVFTVDGVPVLERVFVEEDEADFILAQWRLVARTFTITAQTKAKMLTDSLRRVAVPREVTLVRQVLELDRQLETLDAEIRRTEAQLEEVLADLYGLTDDDRRMIARS